MTLSKERLEARERWFKALEDLNLMIEGLPINQGRTYLAFKHEEAKGVSCCCLGVALLVENEDHTPLCTPGTITFRKDGNELCSYPATEWFSQTYGISEQNADEFMRAAAAANDDILASFPRIARWARRQFDRLDKGLKVQRIDQEEQI
jgi:hypothetical protein